MRYELKNRAQKQHKKRREEMGNSIEGEFTMQKPLTPYILRHKIARTVPPLSRPLQGKGGRDLQLQGVGFFLE